MPYKVYTKDDNPYCVEKTDGEHVGCSDKEHIGAYLGKLDSVAEEEIKTKGISKANLIKGIETLKKTLEQEKIKTSKAYKLITSDAKLTKEEKELVLKQLGSLISKISQTLIFLLPGGSIPILAYNIIKNKLKNKDSIMENKLKGGKGDNMTPKKIADKFDIDVKDVKKQIRKGKKVESEHTNDKEETLEIATDHVTEFPDYYDRLEKMEKEAEKYWSKKEKMDESKLLIKKLLRENLETKNVNQQIQAELKKLGVKPEDAIVIFNDELQTEAIGDNIKESLGRFKTRAAAFSKQVVICANIAAATATNPIVTTAAIGAAAVSCQKTNPYVYKFSYEVDTLITYTLKETTKFDNNLKLDKGQQFGIMGGKVYNPKTMTKLPENMQKEIYDIISNNPNKFTDDSEGQYKPQKQVSSWYMLKKNKLSDNEMKDEADKLATEEMINLENKNANYTIAVDEAGKPKVSLTFEGQSKHGDIATTNGSIPSK